MHRPCLILCICVYGGDCVRVCHVCGGGGVLVLVHACGVSVCVMCV